MKFRSSPNCGIVLFFKFGISVLIIQGGVFIQHLKHISCPKCKGKESEFQITFYIIFFFKSLFRKKKNKPQTASLLKPSKVKYILHWSCATVLNSSSANLASLWVTRILRIQTVSYCINVQDKARGYSQFHCNMIRICSFLQIKPVFNTDNGWTLLSRPNSGIFTWPRLSKESLCSVEISLAQLPSRGCRAAQLTLK